MKVVVIRKKRFSYTAIKFVVRFNSRKKAHKTKHVPGCTEWKNIFKNKTRSVQDANGNLTKTYQLNNFNVIYYTVQFIISVLCFLCGIKLFIQIAFACYKRNSQPPLLIFNNLNIENQFFLFCFFMPLFDLLEQPV